MHAPASPPPRFTGPEVCCCTLPCGGWHARVEWGLPRPPCLGCERVAAGPTLRSAGRKPGSSRSWRRCGRSWRSCASRLRRRQLQGSCPTAAAKVRRAAAVGGLRPHHHGVASECTSLGMQVLPLTHTPTLCSPPCSPAANPQALPSPHTRVPPPPAPRQAPPRALAAAPAPRLPGSRGMARATSAPGAAR